MINMNNAEEAMSKLKELKEKNLPVVTLESFRLMVKKDIIVKDLNEVGVIEEYLSKFYDYSGAENNYCVFSEEKPVFSWGITHGSCTDTKTGIEWRYYHYLTIDGEKTRFDMMLQYHPDCYDIEEEKEDV